MNFWSFFGLKGFLRLLSFQMDLNFETWLQGYVKFDSFFFEIFELVETIFEFWTIFSDNTYLLPYYFFIS